MLLSFLLNEYASNRPGSKGFEDDLTDTEKEKREKLAKKEKQDKTDRESRESRVTSSVKVGDKVDDVSNTALMLRDATHRSAQLSSNVHISNIVNTSKF